jgi:hypothetical protein
LHEHYVLDLIALYFTPIGTEWRMLKCISPPHVLPLSLIVRQSRSYSFSLDWS